MSVTYHTAKSINTIPEQLRSMPIKNNFSHKSITLLVKKKHEKLYHNI